jgi:hypothetical protein
MMNDNRLSHDFNPRFAKQKNGMTGLDFKAYQIGLRKHRFTEEFIQKKIRAYQQCNDNLQKIPFEEFSQFKDLDDFEVINCDFSNRYEWTGGMERKETARLTNLTLVDSETIVGQVNFETYSRPVGKAIVTFKKFGQEWKTDNLDLEP